MSPRSRRRGAADIAMLARCRSAQTFILRSKNPWDRMSALGHSPPRHRVLAATNVRYAWWSQPVAATLYPDRERWSVWRCDKDTFGGSLRQRRPSFGIAGSVASRCRQLGEHLVSRHRRFIFSWPRTGEFLLRHGVAQGWH